MKTNQKSKEELLSELRRDTSRAGEICEQLAGLLTAQEASELVQSKELREQSKIIYNGCLPTLLRPHFPGTLDLFQQRIETEFAESAQLQQTLLLEYYQAALEFEPQKAAQRAPEMDKLVHGLKDKDSSGRLVKAQTLQINYHLRAGNLQKARALMMQARAQKIRVSKDIQQYQDFTSGCVALFCLEYQAAAGYFAEGQFYEQVMICQLLQGNVDATEKTVQDCQKKREGDNTIVLELFQLGMCLKQPKGLGKLRDLAVKIQQKTDFEMQFALDKLVQINVQAHVLKILRPYVKIPLERLAHLTGLDKSILEALLMTLMVDGELDYVIDGSTETLVRVDEQTISSERLLRQACEVVEVLETWV